MVGSDDVEALASGVSEEGDVPEVHGPRIGAYQAPSINLDPVAVQAHLARLGGRRDEDRLLFHISHPGFHDSAAASLTRAITGQNATAPKRPADLTRAEEGLITSQNATAPKLSDEPPRTVRRLITSQNATAPKPVTCGHAMPSRLITSQNATAPKREVLRPLHRQRLITSQNATAPKRELRSIVP